MDVDGNKCLHSNELEEVDPFKPKSIFYMGGGRGGGWMIRAQTIIHIIWSHSIVLGIHHLCGRGGEWGRRPCHPFITHL